MSNTRRYTIFSLYMRGSNQSPQACHGLNNLWKSHVSGEFSNEASSLFIDWAYNSQVEIMLQGGYHEDLENLYAALREIKDMPSAKFNESIQANNGACSLVTFVASDRIVAGNKYVRDNRLTPANASEKLIGVDIPLNDEANSTIQLTEQEVFVISKVAFLQLAN